MSGFDSGSGSGFGFAGGSGGGGTSLPKTQIGFGTGTGITSSRNFTYDGVNSFFSVGFSGGLVINAQISPNPFVTIGDVNNTYNNT